MSVKIMIIDGQAEFRSLLMHHVTTHWPDAIISAYDPIAAGYLPDEFSGAGNDLVLLGNDVGDRDGLTILKQFGKTRGFPAVIYFGKNSEEADAIKYGAEAFFLRKKIRHDALAVQLSDILVSQRRVSVTGALFFGDANAGINPLIRGYRFIDKLGASTHSAIYLAERESTGGNDPQDTAFDLALMLDTLEEDDRAMLIMKYAEGHQYDELAAMFGKTASGCKMRISRARLQLKQRFPEHDFGEDDD